MCAFIVLLRAVRFTDEGLAALKGSIGSLVHSRESEPGEEKRRDFFVFCSSIHKKFSLRLRTFSSNIFNISTVIASFNKMYNFNQI